MSTHRVGILGYQGAIEPHEIIFAKIGIQTTRIRSQKDLALVDRLILPGGESTTMLRFIQENRMMEALREFAKDHPVWGICAGAILAAHEVVSPRQESLSIIDIVAHRNYYGPQGESFSVTLDIDLIETPIKVWFIRAPLLSPTTQEAHALPLKVHAYFNTKPVFFSQGTIWACSFHAELGSDTRLHEIFASM